MFGSENCLPRIVNKLASRKLSFQSRWVKHNVGRQGQFRSLDVFELEKRVEISMGKVMIGSAAVKQELPTIEK